MSSKPIFTTRQSVGLFFLILMTAGFFIVFLNGAASLTSNTEAVTQLEQRLRSTLFAFYLAWFVVSYGLKIRMIIGRKSDYLALISTILWVVTFVLSLILMSSSTVTPLNTPVLLYLGFFFLAVSFWYLVPLIDLFDYCVNWIDSSSPPQETLTEPKPPVRPDASLDSKDSA